MKINRRNFIKLASASGLVLSSTRLELFAQSSAARLKIIVFWEEQFPFVEGVKLTRNFIADALKNHNIIFADADQLKTALAETNVDLFINPFGSAFPKTSWTAILKYLQAGGNFFNFGGKAFAVPVKKNNGVWKAETAQVNYHKRIGILQYTEETGSAYSTLETNIEPLKKMSLDFIVDVYETYPRLTTGVDFPEESGSDGQREAKLEALVLRRNNLGELDCAPVVCFDRLKGEFAGGRWILASIGIADAWTDKFEPPVFKSLAEIASFGAVDFSIKTNFAGYKYLESPTLKVYVENTNEKKNPLKGIGAVEVFNGKNKSVLVTSYRLEERQGKPFEFELNPSKLELQKDFYRIKVSFDATNKAGIKIKTVRETGFWISDETQLQKGNPFTADRHFLYRNNEPFPVVGTTYMASDVHRRFLLEPNPAVWDKDFAEMKAAGVNMIRTGIWTGWKLLANENGEPHEGVLRAFEAFVLTAKKYDIPVIFTFFAFMPEMFGGKNAYLDPLAIAGQKRFLSAFAGRVKNSKDTIWDLINEPSFANPKMLWSCRPNGDEFEKRAWLAWLMRRHNAKDESELRDILTEKLRLRTEEDALALPTNEDFDNVNLMSNRRALKAQEFRLFAQYVFKAWTETMRETLQTAGNKSQFVTVGQDEGGTGDSPSPQFHSDAVDFTCLHNWWANDELLWDNVVSKSPGKPNMIQETGVMSYEKLDGSMWRDEDRTAKLLERKMALALGANACGFIEWVWNTNPFMNIDNEAGIGFLRVDGTVKEELRYFKRIAKFANENRQYFRGKRDENILLVIPHTYQFTPRNLAGEATRKAVRAMHHYCRHTMRAVSEYNLEEILKEKEVPSLIVLPSPQMISNAAVENLLNLVSRGATLAITGYFSDDENLNYRERLEQFSENPSIPVASYEKFAIENKTYEVRFAGDKNQRIFKASNISDNPGFEEYGDGQIIWCHLPLELGETPEPIAAFYKYALTKAKLSPYFSIEQDIASVLVRPTEFENAILYTTINESGSSSFVSITHLPTKTKIDFNLNPEDADMVFVDKQTGKILARS